MTCKSLSATGWGSVFCCAALAVAVPCSRGLAARPDPDTAPVSRVGAQLAWSLSLPLRQTAAIRSYHLLNEYLYAIGTDGAVRCARADNGAFLWNLQVTRAGETLWPPQTYTDPKDGEMLVFVSLNEALFVRSENGSEVRRVRLRSPSAAPPAFASNNVFIPSIDRQLIAYNIQENHVRWRIGTSGPLLLQPLYLPEDDTVVFADLSGRIAAADGTSKVKRFARQLEGEPKGSLAADASAVYVSTSGDVPMLHAMGREKGETLWEYRLEGRPQGGPVVTKSAVYQAVMDGGVHRVGLNQDHPNWYLKTARKFLAEWPHRVVLLMQDGSIGFVEIESGRPASGTALRDLRDGISNVYNDAAIVASARGELRCIRPADGRRLTPEDFGHPATQPAATEAPTPAQEGEDADKPAEEPSAEPPAQP